MNSTAVGKSANSMERSSFSGVPVQAGCRACSAASIRSWASSAGIAASGRRWGRCSRHGIRGRITSVPVTERAGRLVWIDCEMTGLDLARDALIEVAAIVTDGELNPLDDGVEVIIHAADDLLDTMLPVVRDMHSASGLTDAVRASTVTLGEAEKLVLDYVKSHVPEPRSAPLCGNSIGTDRGFVAR